MVAAAAALALAGCGHDGLPGLAMGAPRGATVAFESIDGPPPGQFRTLVQKLNDEAQSRRLAVTSRESPSAYRVRGYLAATAAGGKTTIAWVWDVFDRDEHVALRISGQEAVSSRGSGHRREPWSAADDAMLQRIARSSMEQLTTFLTSSEAVPGAPALPEAPQLASIGAADASPEAAGIFRIRHADPVATETAADAAAADDRSVPLPRRRPAPDMAVSAQETLTLAAAGH